MKISEYIKEYTAGNRITFKYIILEIREFFEALVKFNKKEIKEEFEDIFHFLQLWLFWQFGVDGETWAITKHSVTKFMDRKEVWNKIYEFVGLPRNISGYIGNYKKLEKVVNQLEKFNIDSKKVEEAYNKIVSGK